MSALSVLGALCLAWILLAGSACAAGKRLVKVAFFPMDGYHIAGADGPPDGMDVEYLKALCDYADWSVEYVECGSWEQALQLLADKKVDLVGSAQYSAERLYLWRDCHQCGRQYCL